MAHPAVKLRVLKPGYVLEQLFAVHPRIIILLGYRHNDLQALFDNSFEIQNENVLNQEPVAVNSSALDQNMCSPNNNISVFNITLNENENSQCNYDLQYLA
jgi:hypothetical protein